MTIDENLLEFAGRPVQEYDPDEGLSRPREVAYRLRIDYEQFSDGTEINDLLGKLLDDSRASEIAALVIGAWDYESSVDSTAIVAQLVAGASRLPRLEALFLGDITMEEQEISWIHHGDISALFDAYPDLKVLRVRGSDGLRIKPIVHSNLEELAFESGGLPGEVITAVASSEMPKLRHLELWLGDSGYGYTGSVDLLAPILSAQGFPALRHLALKNSEDQDAIARAVATAPVLAQLSVLDLSMGTLTDEGASALVESPSIRALFKLDVHYHYLSEPMVKKLGSLGIQVDASECQEADGDHRYVAVAE